LQSLQIVEAVILAAFVSAAALRLRILTVSGATAAFVVGALVFTFGGLDAAIPLLAFFATASLLGRWRKADKERLGFEKGGARDWAQVIANSGIAVAMLLMARVTVGFHGSTTVSHILMLAFVAAVAEANADTWATEIGAASGVSPRLITSLQVVDAGRSGGVSLAGLGAAVAGALLVSLSALPILHTVHDTILVAFAGFSGSVADSVFGATIQVAYVGREGRITDCGAGHQRPIAGCPHVTNDVVNALGTASAAAIVAILMVCNV